jgi:hypothetical protein
MGVSSSDTACTRVFFRLLFWEINLTILSTPRAIAIEEIVAASLLLRTIGV